MSRTRRSIFATLLVLMTSAHAIAQATQPTNLIRRSSSGDVASTTQPVASGALDGGRVFFALAAVLGLIFLLRAGLKRFSPNALARGSGAIRVVGKTYLSPKQQVIVLQVGRRVLVVGDSGGKLNTLCEITDADEAAHLLSQLTGTERDTPPEAFAQTLARAEEEFDSTKPVTTPADPVIDTARTELNGLAERIRLLSRHLKRA